MRHNFLFFFANMSDDDGSPSPPPDPSDDEFVPKSLSSFMRNMLESEEEEEPEMVVLKKKTPIKNNAKRPSTSSSSSSSSSSKKPTIQAQAVHRQPAIPAYEPPAGHWVRRLNVPPAPNESWMPHLKMDAGCALSVKDLVELSSSISVERCFNMHTVKLT